MSYRFGVTVDRPFESVVEAARAALADEGFGVLSEIDVKATLKAKLDLDQDPYLILGACNPPFAHQALSAEPGIGVLLPCNVVVRQEGERVVVDFMDPEAVLDLVDRPEVAPIAAEVKARLARVADALVRA